MDNGKITLKIGAIEFIGEGKEQWVAAQLEKIILNSRELLNLQKNSSSRTNPLSVLEPVNTPHSSNATLSAFLKNTGATENQVKRFLATALWLNNQGETHLSPSVVTQALTKHKQKLLTNAANCLNQNVTKGFCEKNSTGFYITEDGIRSLNLK